MALSRFIPLALMLALSACSFSPKGGGERLYLEEVSYRELPGWTEDNAAEALPPLKKSCARILKKDPAADFGAGGIAGRAGDWQGPCAALENAPDARAYFEAQFVPYAVYGNAGREGLFTGYYQPLLKGSFEKKAPYLTPLYARPVSMVTADLGLFSEELKGKSVTGMVEARPDGARLIPFPTRAAIEAGALDGAEKIVWVDDPVDAFFLHIQGSGIVRMEDGTELQVGYAAQNGRPYTAIGRELIKRGEMTKENVSMQSIRAWLEAHPAEAPGVMNVNASYVFFKKLEGEGPLGAEGVALTPHRSVAVDRKLIPYGAPLFIDAEHPAGTGRLQRLLIAQDTGGAITGAVRGDYFWGAGDEATEMAGKMKSRGMSYILLPKGVKVPEEKEWHFWRALSLAGSAAGRPVYND